jgi:hypothetical protein
MYNFTKIDFPGFPGLDFGILKFHDFPGFPGPVRTRLLRYLKKTENRYRKKNTDNTDISVLFFRNCILLNFMQNLLNLI